MGVLDKFRLDGKVAVVTGASSGLGVAFALALAEAGAIVTLGGRRLERLQDTKLQIEERGGRAYAVQTDVTDPEDCAALAEAAVSQFERLDILINSAGLGASVPASRETPDQFRRIVDTNLMGSYWMAQACAKYMTSGSSIINVSSVLAFTTTKLPQAAYASSKAALIGLTRDLAQQWTGRKGIRVNVIAPGYFLTEMTDDLDAEFIRYITQERVPMGRLGELEECASTAVFLASDAASFITGTCLVVDGGLMTA